MQTELIKQTKVFNDFEKNFSHFFEECERGFINEFIISMYCRIVSPGKTILSYSSSFKELYFIKSGVVAMYNNENDEIVKN
jgi:hypothetical protein